MDSLDDIWDAPVEPSVPQQDVGQRPRSSLFLPGSDDEHDERGDPGPTAAAAASSTNPDIDALFADIDNQVLSYQPALDLDALRREADARHAKTTLTPHAVLPGSSPEKDVDDNHSDDKGKKDAGGKKERKKVPRLDEGRLLGPDGFPRLIRDTKNFKPKGKGHEAADLNRLLQIYQFWTHKMYPKTQFKDTVERVEKICHSRRMHVSLSVWRDEAHDIVNGRRPDDAEQPVDLTSDADADADASPAHSRPQSRAPAQPQQTTSASPPPASRPPTRPPSSASERTSPELDDFDVDAFLQEAEANLESVPKSNNPSAKGASDNGMDADEEMWDELNRFDDPAPPPQRAPQVPAPLQQPRPARSVGFAASLDEDEDMWDVVHEMEMEAADAGKNSQLDQGSSVPTPNATAGPEDDWDDMYL